MSLIILHNSPSVAFETRERCSIEELLNIEAVSDVSVARARVKPGVRTELHAVSGTREIYIIEQGIGLVDDGKQNPTEVSAGNIIIIPADHAQHIYNNGNDELVFLCVCTPRFEQHHYQFLSNTE